MVEKQLKSRLFQAVRLSTGMMKQNSSPFLKIYGGIRDITKQHIKLTHDYLHTKLAAPIDDAHRTLVWKDLTDPQQINSSPLNNFIEKDTFLQQHFTRTETLSPFPVPPWSPQIAKITDSQLTKEQAKEELEKQMNTKLTSDTLVFFADGSLIPRKGGGAVVIPTNTQATKTKHVGRDSIITNFETELMALLLCQELLSKQINTYGPPAIAIFSYSQASPYQSGKPLDNT
ncbi:hypothetical protein O181_061008 [Austropuccinia psidii MF-1]|uniref:RNase H type-1 domain-containing protein n=1 Tax=Austropuccinia psidii MF-1 TaxID=1389203 RepID=A0A9Q3ELY3_9BASI|nr:hypothetical protein [Austropuccinia psidii MF-1]